MALTAEQQAALKRAMDAATEAARRGLEALDARTQREVLALHERAAEQIAALLRQAAGGDGSIDQHELRTLIAGVELVLMQLRDRQLELLQEALKKAAENGATVVGYLNQDAEAGRIASSSVGRLPDAADAAQEVLQAVLHQIAEDGLDLSDRIWRNWQAVRAQLLPVIQSSVIRGATARAATREALLRGESPAEELLDQVELARAGSLSASVEGLLGSAGGIAYSLAQRVFRTEMDRANILAARAGIYNTEGVVGTRFKLSPAHPRFDVCDMHASVNLYGLGPGVYPPGASPLPAHPNTLSYEEAVFEWEIRDEDKAGRTDVLTWLSGRRDDELYGVLQSADKVRALRQGLLQPGEITIPWRELRGKYESQLHPP